MGNEKVPGSEEPDEELIDRSEEALRKITEKEDTEDRYFYSLLEEFAREALHKNYERLKQIDLDVTEQYKEHVQRTRSWAQRMGEEIDQLFGGKKDD